MRLLVALYACLCLLGPAMAETPVKDPLNYPLRQYGFVLLTALLGGLVSWYAKVRKGEVAAWNLSQLIGELCTSAFAGLLAFWICEWMSTPAILTPALVGISGHMGTRAIQAFEDMARRRYGNPPRSPHDEK
jgi:hypothetical protein